MKERTKKRLKRIGKIALGTVGLVCAYKIGNWLGHLCGPEPGLPKNFVKALDSEDVERVRVYAEPSGKGRYIRVTSELITKFGEVIPGLKYEVKR